MPKGTDLWSLQLLQWALQFLHFLVVTLIPATSPTVQSENQPVPASVAPISKMKKFLWKSECLAERDKDEGEGEGENEDEDEDGAGLSQSWEEEEETEIIQFLTLSELWVSEKIMAIDQANTLSPGCSSAGMVEPVAWT